ncbi:MAG TPA: DUF934 domain-containing protein [Stellaceae bacterium]|nr:DUF934 domain-containing protein [Stellaceae bacterium]
MPLIKNERFVTDTWRHLADDEGVPDATRLTFSYARWAEQREAFAALPAALGVRIPNDVSPMKLAPDLARLSLIVLSFPKFTDGRAYSQARLLRGRLGFTGELRAEGEVLRDQLLFMRRCGFETFAVGERALAENWLAAFREIDVFYQPAEDSELPVWRRRLAAARRDFTVV